MTFSLVLGSILLKMTDEEKPCGDCFCTIHPMVVNCFESDKSFGISYHCILRLFPLLLLTMLREQIHRKLASP